MKKTVLLISFLCFLHFSYGQNKLLNSIIYLSNGDTIKGKINYNFMSKSSIKFYTGIEKRRISKYKIDSMLVDSTYYLIGKTPFAVYTMKPLSKGKIDLYTLWNNNLLLKRDSSIFYLIAPNDYRIAYNIFSGKQLKEQYVKTDRKTFISLIKQYNSTTTKNDSTPVPFDSLRRSTKDIIVRLSFLRPEIGFEIKLSDNVSVFNSVGLNFWGNSLRYAKTFVNYDYSAELRIYYNRNRRLTNGESVHNFSCPFIAATYKYMIETSRPNINTYGILFGWQENSFFNKAFSGYRVGLGYTPEYNGIIFMSLFSLGWGI